MRMGLVGATIYYGGFLAVFGYIGWEIYGLGNRMVQIDEDHPANEIFKHNSMAYQKSKEMHDEKKQKPNLWKQLLEEEKNEQKLKREQLFEQKTLEEQRQKQQQQQSTEEYM